MKVLIVEDENNLGETLKDFLQSIGHETFWAENAAIARKHFNEQAPSVIIMDIGLPDGNGLDLAKEFRQIRKDFVLLFLSALNDPEIKVQGLEIGAEDYITKPFALKEITLRLDRILSYQKESDVLPEEITHGNLKIWFKRFEVQDAQNNIINLSHKECLILKLLYKNKNSAVTREQIIEEVWGDDKFPSNRTVDNYIVKLRKWSESDQSQELEIQSIRGVGYKLNIN